MGALARFSCLACGQELEPGASECPRDGTPVDQVELSATDIKDPLVGQQLGEYRVERRIGFGGMGIVYEGVHPLIGKRAAIKVLRWDASDDPIETGQLLEEARVVNSIRCRGIVDIFGFGRMPDGRHYFAMELLEGERLDVFIRERAPMTAAEAIPILDEVLASLAAAHGVGVIHRDLKPHNIFLVSQAHGPRYVKLLDFGLAKRGAFQGAPASVSGVAGTLGYMAPEQALGEKVQPQTDLYAVGVVAYEMLTGQLPFPGNNLVALVQLQTSGPPPRPSSRNRALPAALDDLVFSLLAPRLEDRPRSAEEVRVQLRRISKDESRGETQRVSGEQPAAVEAPTAARPNAADTIRRKPRAVVIGLVLAVCVAALGAAALWISRPAEGPTVHPGPLPAAPRLPPPVAPPPPASAPPAAPVVPPAPKPQLARPPPTGRQPKVAVPSRREVLRELDKCKQQLQREAQRAGGSAASEISLLNAACAGLIAHPSEENRRECSSAVQEMRRSRGLDSPR